MSNNNDTSIMSANVAELKPGINFNKGYLKTTGCLEFGNRRKAAVVFR